MSLSLMLLHLHLIQCCRGAGFFKAWPLSLGFDSFFFGLTRSQLRVQVKKNLNMPNNLLVLVSFIKTRLVLVNERFKGEKNMKAASEW